MSGMCGAVGGGRCSVGGQCAAHRVLLAGMGVTCVRCAVRHGLAGRSAPRCTGRTAAASARGGAAATRRPRWRARR
eukprot:6710386-Prymnesium_polylepis.1